MLEAKDWVNFSLTFLNIVVTGFFSFLVWRATRKGVELSETIHNSKKKEEANLREGIRWRVIGNLSRIYLVELPKIVANINTIEKIKMLVPDEETIAINFDLEEQKRIYTYLSSLDEHLESYSGGKSAIRNISTVEIANLTKSLIEYLKERN